MSTPGVTPERLDELESRLAFQDDLVIQLNDVVARQDRLITDLQLRISKLEKRIEDLSEGAAVSGGGDGFEVPPHY